MVDPDGVQALASAGPAQVVMAILGVNQRMNDSLSLSLSDCERGTHAGMHASSSQSLYFSIKQNRKTLGPGVIA